jgi:hypothetical protein
MTYVEMSGTQQIETPTSLSARDEFNQTAGALGGKTAPVGGVWLITTPGSGLTVETAGHTVQRTATGDGAAQTSGAFAWNGSPMAATLVQRDLSLSAIPATRAAGYRLGVFARGTNTSGAVVANNWVAATLDPESKDVAAGASNGTPTSPRKRFRGKGHWPLRGLRRSVRAQPNWSPAPVLPQMRRSCGRKSPLAGRKPRTDRDLQAAQRRGPLQARACEWCGAWFDPPRRDSTVCSPSCLRERKNGRERARRRAA